MDDAGEEVVGDAVGKMLDDKDYAERLAYNLKHPVLSAIKDFLTQIKDAIVKAFGGGSDEARKVNDLLRTINKAYRKAVKEAKRQAMEKDGVDQYTRERNREKAMHDDVMREYVKRTVEDGKLSEEAGKAFLEENGIKYSLREEETPGEEEMSADDGKKYSPREEDENEKVLRDVVIDHLNEKNGISTSIDQEAGQRVLDMANERDVKLNAKQKRALETATIADESTNNATAISSADGAKAQNNLETLAEGYDNRSNKTKGFITDLSQALNLEQHEASHYGTFETQNGKLVTIRVSNHNDKNGEEDGISIVISNHKNKGVPNDGNAHIVEYFNPKQSLQKAESKPLSDIVRSVSEALNSGEFNDITGLAQRQEVNDNRIREHRVYHGSGADFEEFDHSHMGEGEGLQIHGYGFIE